MTNWTAYGEMSEELNKPCINKSSNMCEFSGYYINCSLTEEEVDMHIRNNKEEISRLNGNRTYTDEEKAVIKKYKEM